METQINLQNVGKKYVSHVILEQINLAIEEGDSIALTGHNGAGKSTLLKLIGGFVPYDTGKISYRKNIRIRYVPEYFPRLNVTARDYISSMSQILGISRNEAKSKSQELFERFFMGDMADTPIKYLSKGTKQKVAVIQALLMASNVLLLDEPLSGQDTDSQRYFIQEVKRLNRKGTAIVMACHEKWLMEAVSKTVYIIDDKKLYKKEENISGGEGYAVMTFEKRKKSDFEEELDGMALQELVMKKETHGNQTEILVRKEDSQRVLIKMLQSGYELRRMQDERLE